MHLKEYSFYALGDSAIVIQLGDQIDPIINAKIRSICEWLDEYTFEGFVEYVPAYTTVTIYYQPWKIGYEELSEMIGEMLNEISGTSELRNKVIEIPVSYGGVGGPDLEIVASHNNLTVQEVVSLHSNINYLVYMIGFAPGFPYLGGLDQKISTPRKANPRSKIPAGSVGIAGMQTGIYPIETPGGWQIIGRTPIALFDLERASPSLLKAGDFVRFKPITEEEFINFTPGDYGY